MTHWPLYLVYFRLDSIADLFLHLFEKTLHCFHGYCAWEIFIFNYLQLTIRFLLFYLLLTYFLLFHQLSFPSIHDQVCKEYKFPWFFIVVCFDSQWILSIFNNINILHFNNSIIKNWLLSFFSRKTMSISWIANPFLTRSSYRIDKKTILLILFFVQEFAFCEKVLYIRIFQDD